MTLPGEQLSTDLDITNRQVMGSWILHKLEAARGNTDSRLLRYGNRWVFSCPLGELTIKANALQRSVQYAELLTPRFVSELPNHAILSFFAADATPEPMKLAWLEEDVWQSHEFAGQVPMPSQSFGFEAERVLTDFTAAVDAIAA